VLEGALPLPQAARTRVMAAAINRAIVFFILYFLSFLIQFLPGGGEEVGKTLGVAVALVAGDAADVVAPQKGPLGVVFDQVALGLKQFIAATFWS